MTTPDEKSATRVDQWLWAMRIFKTRSLAGGACRAGSVTVNELPAKPGRDVHAGEVIVVQQGLFRRTVQVVAVPRSRVGAKLVPQYCTDLTPLEEFARARERSGQQLLAREKAAAGRRSATGGCWSAFWSSLEDTKHRSSLSPNPGNHQWLRA